MRSLLLFVAFLCALAVSNSSRPAMMQATSFAQNESAMMKFNSPVKVMGVTLQGDYLFVHDDAAMARGEDCTYIYKGEAQNPRMLAVSFHCTPELRAKVGRFTVRTWLNAAGQYELRDYQFAGSNEAHLVPSAHHLAHVNLAP